MSHAGQRGKILLFAAILGTGAKTGEGDFFAILRMAFRIVTKYPLVPGAGPA